MGPTRRALAQSLTAAAALAAWPGAAAAAVKADDMVLGNPKAKVTVYEYASVTCPHCATWHADVFPAFRAKYIDTGRILFVFRELPTAPAEVSAAGFMVARCGPKAKYFDVIASLMAGQRAMLDGSPWDWLNAAGAKAGLNPQQVRACALNQAQLDALNARVERNLGEHSGIGSTPTFVINGTVYAGERSMAELDSIIQPLLGP